MLSPPPFIEGCRFPLELHLLEHKGKVCFLPSHLLQTDLIYLLSMETKQTINLHSLRAEQQASCATVDALVSSLLTYDGAHRHRVKGSPCACETERYQLKTYHSILIPTKQEQQLHLKTCLGMHVCGVLLLLSPSLYPTASDF